MVDAVSAENFNAPVIHEHRERDGQFSLGVPEGFRYSSLDAYVLKSFVKLSQCIGIRVFFHLKPSLGEILRNGMWTHFRRVFLDVVAHETPLISGSFKTGNVEHSTKERY
jgi:hypothetical protein